ncbi:lipopolysaccharide biosynthesis protein [Parasphingorhabdus halotolerans]|uniref:Lipopolysaccharide biosynthesis protein n=1 Tax=Parasphingorhabdus halotolerans TaxID=2725558 RepID=A0A6H2DNH3_9SPHN|nr:lipopolysaccharide biosynthesis protein [Parasphingorhabdus halotolerans]QJB70209.1 lipopolysaccharide biosynthesis protein [Parasphingorhabdus halotolerans]
MLNATTPSAEDASFGNRVRSAVFWRSGTQILAQIIAWGSTLVVIRILDPHDYGIFAMTQVILVFLSFMNGYGLASSIIQSEKVEPLEIRQAFGMLLLLNGGIAILQLILAPFAAEYYRQPIIADLLRVQALILLSTPFLVLPEALMTRNLEFRKPAIINLISAAVGASTALYCAYNGYGVWTLVYAPLSIFWSRAICLVIAVKFYILPTFNFKGAGKMFGFGATLLASHLFWTIQSQSDIFIAGRYLNPHDLGLYAEALFLTTIFAAKFVPPLNEVAFPAYSRLQSNPQALAWSFLKAIRLIMLISCPLYMGMAVTAYPLVETLFGPKWTEMSPFVAILALAMPVMTLQILFTPANNALGRPQITARTNMFGALLMPVTFLIGIQFGVYGLAWGWVIAFPLLTIFTYLQSHKHIGVDAWEITKAVWPGLSASVAMAAVVYLADQFLPNMIAYKRLAVLVIIGAAAYVGLLYILAKPTLMEVIQLIVRRKPPEPTPAELAS